VLLAVNLVGISVIFLIAEMGLRMRSLGFSGALASLLKTQVPYSDLGTSNWVIYDKDLGYRLNPNRHARQAKGIFVLAFLLFRNDLRSRIRFRMKVFRSSTSHSISSPFCT